MKSKKVIVMVMCFIIVSCLLVACTPKDSEVLISYGDKNVSFGLANLFARYSQGSLESLYKSTGTDIDKIWKQAASKGSTETMQASLKKDLLNSLEEMIIFDANQSDLGISLSSEDTKAIDEATEKFIEANGEKELKRISATKENVKEMLRLMKIKVLATNKIKENANINKDDQDASTKEKEAYDNKVKEYKDKQELKVDESKWKKIDFNEFAITPKE